jgi:predicted PurR-regulated permease PerM
MEQKEEYTKAFYLVVGLGMIALVFLIIKPVFNALAGGAILAYLFYPVYRLLNKRGKRPNLAAFITTFVIILLVLVPLGFIVGSIANKEARTLVRFARSISASDFEESCTEEDSIKCKLVQFGLMVNERIEFNEYIKNFLIQVANRAGALTTSFLAGLPWHFLMLFVVFFSTFVFLRDGKDIFVKYGHLIPITPAHRSHFVKKFRDVSYGVVYGTIMVALAQGFLATIGFWAFGVSTPLFWGLCVFIVSILPVIAPPIVYLPLSAYKLVNGLAAGNSGDVLNGILLGAWGLLVVSIVDNIIRWKVTSSKSNMHPLLVLIGILGGLRLFGIVGIFLGPLALVFALTLTEIYHSK